MRVKSRTLIIAAVAAAFLGAGPAFASDESAAEPAAPSPWAPAEELPDPGDGAPAEEVPDPGPWEKPSEEHEEVPEGMPPGFGHPNQSAPSTPIEKEPNYTG